MFFEIKKWSWNLEQIGNLRPEGRPGGNLGSAQRNVRGCQEGAKRGDFASKALNQEPRTAGLENPRLGKTLPPRFAIFELLEVLENIENIF